MENLPAHALKKLARLYERRDGFQGKSQEILRARQALSERARNLSFARQNAADRRVNMTSDLSRLDAEEARIRNETSIINQRYLDFSEEQAMLLRFIEKCEKSLRAAGYFLSGEGPDTADIGGPGLSLGARQTDGYQYGGSK